jgi:thioredoxin-like negative regulator of GroEL
MPSLKPWINGLVLFNICTLSFAQTPALNDPAAQKTPELNAIQRAFTNLPEQKRIDYLKHMDEVRRLFNQKRIFEAMDEITNARKIFDKNSEIHNMLGSCYVEFRDFKKAHVEFDKALALEPGLAAVIFNIAELEFVTRQWKSAEEKLELTLKKLPEGDIATRRLVEFKILLCKIAQGKDSEVNALAEKYNPLDDDSPFYYYAQASLCFRDNDVMKAEEWMQIANRVFANPDITAPWQDTLIEFGYIESFYGSKVDQQVNDAPPKDK